MSTVTTSQNSFDGASRISQKNWNSFSHNFLPKTAYENIAFAMEVCGYTDAQSKKVPEVLELAELTTAKHHFPHMLSGGETKSSIARALIHKPRLIIADEPTGTLILKPQKK